MEFTDKIKRFRACQIFCVKRVSTFRTAKSIENEKGFIIENFTLEVSGKMTITQIFSHVKVRI
jgi:hypothetical protein